MAMIKPRRTFSRRFTPERLEGTANEKSYELDDDGTLVRRELGSESSELAAEIIFLIRRFLETSPLGRVYGADLGMVLWPDEPVRLRRPDVAFIRHERLDDGRSPRSDLRIAPDLIVEVISPRDRSARFELKVGQYFEAGVRLVWVVYPDGRTVHVRRADGTAAILRESDTLDGEDVLPGFSVAVAAIFAPLSRGR